ncbi:ERMAP protein, partial [Neodrepanis coruscans]|nr:ERMAP protein [Neodrepanis coruscans]
WALGVAKDSVARKGRVRVNPGSGIWALGHCGGQCQALTSPALPLALPEPPELVGVFLDYQGGRVAFWDCGKGVPLF